MRRRANSSRRCSSAARGRAELWAWLHEPFGLLMRQLAERHRLDAPHDRNTRHALHLAETYLRTRPASDYVDQSWAAFRAALLLLVGKLAIRPYAGQGGPVHGPDPLPEVTGYQTRTLFMPHHQVGGQGFGGDWFGGACADDGTLWVLVADVTGHGYAAYLLASALPAVWEKCWDAAGREGEAPAEPAASGSAGASPSPPAGAREPTGLLLAMHRLLEECLPDGVFVECTLARLRPDGAVTISPAGGTRFLLRRGGRVELVRLRGGWLGLLTPLDRDRHDLRLAAGDELLLGTDGFFDQLAVLGEPMPGDLQRLSNFRPLFDQARDLLECRPQGGAPSRRHHAGAIAAADGAGRAGRNRAVSPHPTLSPRGRG